MTDAILKGDRYTEAKGKVGALPAVFSSRRSRCWGRAPPEQQSKRGLPLSDTITSYDADIDSSDGRVKIVLRTLEQLPSPPEVILRALNMALDDDVSPDQLAKVVELDQSLTLQFINATNSPFYGLSRKVSTVSQAFALLGLANVRFFLMGLFADHMFSSTSFQKQAVTLWRHAIACASAARMVAEKTYPELKYEAFAAGILHDMGKNLLLLAFPDQFSKVMEMSRSGQVSTIRTENRIFNVDHTLAGKWMADRWRLPQGLCHAVWMHHQPLEVLESLAHYAPLVRMVMLADHMAHFHLFDPVQEGRDEWEQALLESLGLGPEDYRSCCLQLPKVYSERAAMFKAVDNPEEAYQELIRRANRRLSASAMELESRNTDLDRTNRMLRIISRAGLYLTGVRTCLDVADAMAKTMAGNDLFDAGFLFTDESETRTLEGRAWIGENPPMRIFCRYDASKWPQWGPEKDRLSVQIIQMMDMYLKKSRTSTAGMVEDFADPFGYRVIPLRGEVLRGELGLRLVRGKFGGANRVPAGFSQLGNLVSETLRRVEVLQALERRSEDLSGALMCNRQINEKLIQSERLAAVGQLAAGAAHEINNPLSVVYARAQILQDREEDLKKKRSLEQICRQIERITKILNNLMDYARPRPPKPMDVNFNRQIEKILELLGNTLSRSKIQVQTRLDPNLPSVKADPGQMEQVLFNVIINALHAMEETGGTLTFSTGATPDGQTVRVAVTDTGVGIAEKHLSKIFDPFFTTKEEGKGTGLGLSISYGIVNNHCGDIRVDSREGEGTRVTIELPVDTAFLDAAPVSAGIGDSKNPVRILVVDDEAHIREVLTEALEAEGFEVKTAKDGEMALHVLDETPCDLMLVDIRMPVRSGLSLLASVQKRRPSIPSLVITGLGTHEEMEEALRKGAVQCIRKPFHIKNLIRQIHKTLSKTGRAE